MNRPETDSMPNKGIGVKLDTWRTMMTLKVSYNLPSHDATIRFLISEATKHNKELEEVIRRG